MPRMVCPLSAFVTRDFYGSAPATNDFRTPAAEDRCDVTRLLAAALVAAALAGCGGTTTSSAACWRTLLGDVYDGHIDHSYHVDCYETAIRHLPNGPVYSTIPATLKRGLGNAAGDVIPPQSSWLGVAAADAKARQQAAAVLANWKRGLAKGNGVLARSRLARASRLYHFTTIRLASIDANPLVLVQTDDPAGLSRSVPSIMRLLDPRRRYEAFFFEAQDSRGVPFLIVFNDWRPPHAGGGQWASSADLYPYPHG
jgi:hypothetical protein